MATETYDPMGGFIYEPVYFERYSDGATREQAVDYPSGFRVVSEPTPPTPKPITRWQRVKRFLVLALESWGEIMAEDGQMGGWFY